MVKLFSRALAMLAMLAGLSPPGTARIGAAGPALIPRAGKERGKGGKRPHRAGNGSRRIKRQAVKTRNVKRHKMACKGHANIL
jgi:hypothetical protein